MNPQGQTRSPHCASLSPQDQIGPPLFTIMSFQDQKQPRVHIVESPRLKQTPHYAYLNPKVKIDIHYICIFRAPRPKQTPIILLYEVPKPKKTYVTFFSTLKIKINPIMHHYNKRGVYCNPNIIANNKEKSFRKPAVANHNFSQTLKLLRNHNIRTHTIASSSQLPKLIQS